MLLLKSKIIFLNLASHCAISNMNFSSKILTKFSPDTFILVFISTVLIFSELFRTKFTVGLSALAFSQVNFNLTIHYNLV